MKEDLVHNKNWFKVSKFRVLSHFTKGLQGVDTYKEPDREVFLVLGTPTICGQGHLYHARLNNICKRGQKKAPLIGGLEDSPAIYFSVIDSSGCNDLVVARVEAEMKNGN